MAYEKQTWETGEVITAEKLNHMESGIEGEGSGSDKFAVISTSASDFGSGSKTFGKIVYAVYDDEAGDWVVINDSDYADPYFQIAGLAEPYNRYLPPIPVPHSDKYAPFLLVLTGTPLISGDISTTPEDIYTGYGSRLAGTAYRIFGNGSVKFQNLI